MNMKLKVSTEDKVRLLSALQRDSQFLAKINTLDYSLLVGIIDNDESDATQDNLDEGGKPGLTSIDSVGLSDEEIEENISHTII